MNKFYKIKFEPNKSYTIKLCSLEKKYVFYRNNFQRVCYENYKLKEEINKQESRGIRVGMSEEDLIRLQFQNILGKLVGSKIQPTATAIMSVRQPMVQLFEELMYKLNKLQKENQELKEKIREFKIGRLGE